jgi:hypothetical protein
MFQRIYSDKRDISVTFLRRAAPLRLVLFDNLASFDGLFLSGNVGFAGEMQMFENLAAEA